MCQDGKRDCRQREKGLATSRPTHGGPASAEWSSLLSRGRSNLSWRQLLASSSLFVSVRASPVQYMHKHAPAAEKGSDGGRLLSARDLRRRQRDAGIGRTLQHPGGLFRSLPVAHEALGRRGKRGEERRGGKQSICTVRGTGAIWPSWYSAGSLPRCGCWRYHRRRLVAGRSGRAVSSSIASTSSSTTICCV